MVALGTGGCPMAVQDIDSFHRPQGAHNLHRAVRLSELVEQTLSHQYQFPHHPPVKEICISKSALVHNENQGND